MPNSKETILDLRDGPLSGVKIAGVTEIKVEDTEQVMNHLFIGNKRRSTESTNANQTSSRSHAVFQIMLCAQDKTRNTDMEVLCGKLSLIDLAGSERGTVTENRGIRLREGAKINTSLLALANCINALGDNAKKGFFVPYRDSKLTRMLKDSLGGNCQTVMIATVGPSAFQYEETVNTLKYANRAKNIKTRVQPNKKMVYLHISAYKNIIADLRDEIDRLKTQLRSHQTYRPSIQLTNVKDDEKLQETKEEKQQETKEEIHRQRNCHCKSRAKDEEEKKIIESEIVPIYEEIIQLEQSLIELDEQNTLNAIEIRKREAKMYLLDKQSNDYAERELQKDTGQSIDDESRNNLNRHMDLHKEQIRILTESTNENLIKRQIMKNQLAENYDNIKIVRNSIASRIRHEEVKEYLELVIKNNFLELQNVQLLLNLQLQSRTISDLKDMVMKQQNYIEQLDLNPRERMEISLDNQLNDLVFEELNEDEQYLSDINQFLDAAQIINLDIDTEDVVIKKDIKETDLSGLKKKESKASLADKKTSKEYIKKIPSNSVIAESGSSTRKAPLPTKQTKPPKKK